MKKPIPFDVTRNKEEQEPMEELRLGATKVREDLYLVGEDDIEEIVDQLDVIIDFRNESIWNRCVYIPESLSYIRMPFYDGDIEGMKRILPLAKTLADYAKKNNQRVAVMCHAGISRSATLVTWLLATECGSWEKAWSYLSSLRPVRLDPAFDPFINELKQTLKDEKHEKRNSR